MIFQLLKYRLFILVKQTFEQKIYRPQNRKSQKYEKN